MNIKAVGDFVVLAVVEAPTHIGSIEIPEENRERIRKRNIGTVLSAGPDVPYGIKVGDVIAYRDFPNPPCFCYGLDGEARILVPSAEIVGLVDSDEQANPDREREIKDQNRKIDGERSAKQSLVIASGSSLNGNRIKS